MNFPSIFFIETMLGCNLRCVECAVGSKLIKRKFGAMSLAAYARIVPKIKPYCRYSYMHTWGEPMINPDIIDMLKLAATFTRTNISTNAIPLDRHLAKDLIFSGVSDIIVSIDGMSQETYATYRRRGSLADALHGLAYLIQFNKRRSPPIPISPQFIVFEHNKHEMQAFADFCAGLGVAPTFKAPYLRPNSVLRNSGLPQWERHQAPTPEGRRQAMRACELHDVFNILLDGSVVACCYDHNGVTTFGNIFTQSVEEIWSSEAFTTFRNQVRDGHAPAFCMENCLMY